MDFAQLKLADKLSVDYNYVAFEDINNIDKSFNWRDVDSSEKITIRKKDYLELLEQSAYLNELINTDKLVNYIVSCGGKTYEQLVKK